MANSTSNIDPIIASQASKEVTANAFFDAASQAITYGRRASTSTGLTWGFYGGNVLLSGGSMSQVANGTVALTASTTNYIVAQKSTGTVTTSTATTNWNDDANYWRLYSVVTGTSTVTSWTDSRLMGSFTSSGGGGGGGITALTGDVTSSGTGSVPATIANDAVTYAKMQNVSATDKLLGRSSSGAGDVEEITCTAAGRALLDDSDAAAQRTTLEISNHNNITVDASGNITAFGGNITFPATQSPSAGANTLDDYEEGTFTPTVVGSTTPGSATYSDQTGRYTKIGHLVLGSFRIVLTSRGGMVGQVRIGNLPFSIANFSSARAGINTAFIGGMNLGSNIPLMFMAINNTDYYAAYKQATTGNPTNLTESEITDTFIINGSFAYETAN